MTPKAFVKIVHKEVLEEGHRFYVTKLDTLDSSQVSDPYWSSALALYESLDEAGQNALKKFIRHILVDTVATFLGMLDGTSCVEGLDEDLVLTTETDSTQVNEFIQELFFMAEEMGSDEVLGN